MFTKLIENKIYKKIIAIGMALLLLFGLFLATQESAHAGVIKGTTKNQQRAAIYYTYTQNKDTCKTTLTVRLRVYATGSTYNTYKSDAPWSLTYNGTTKTGTKDYSCPSSGSYTNISSSYSKTITQSNGAAKDISLSGWINLSGTSIGGKLSVSDTITLPAFRPSTTYSSTTVSGKIVWDDDNDRDGKRPSSVTVTLKRNGSDLKTTSASSSFKWTGLYTYASGGSAYTYTVAGSSVTGYTKSVSGTTITYTHKPETVSFTGNVVWDDDNNRDGIRPAAANVNILRDGVIVDGYTKVANNNEFSYTGWKLYHDGGKKYTFTFAGEEIPGYTMTASGTTITYKHTPETTAIKGTLTWDDDDNANSVRPSSVPVSLLVNGTVKETITTDASKGWTYDFGTEYLYNSGNKITYQIYVPEVSDYVYLVKGYDVTYALVGRLGVVFGFSL